MKVLTTGISGFVGRHVSALLTAQGHEVVGTYWGDPPSLDLEAHALDLRDRDGIERIVHEVAPDRILHLAALSHVGTSWKRMPAYFEINTLGTERLVEAAGTTGVILASSGEVYGDVPADEQPVGEDAPVAPRNPYALTKAAAERFVLAGGGTVVRMFNLVGPGQAETFALPAFASQLAAIGRGEREPVLLVGNLDVERDFLHVADGAEALALLTTDTTVSGVFNLASGEATSLRRVLDLLVAASGIPARIEVDPERLRPADIVRSSGRAERLRDLGWAPRRSLVEAVQDLWESVTVRLAVS